MGHSAKGLAGETESTPVPQTQNYKLQLVELADELSTRCKTHAHLLKAEDIQAVINVLAELIEHLDDHIAMLGPTQGKQIEQMKALRKFADGVRNRCFSLLDGFNAGSKMKPPEFYDVLSPLPAQLSHLAQLLPPNLPAG